MVITCWGLVIRKKEVTLSQVQESFSPWGRREGDTFQFLFWFSLWNTHRDGSFKLYTLSLPQLDHYSSPPHHCKKKQIYSQKASSRTKTFSDHWKPLGTCDKPHKSLPKLAMTHGPLMSLKFKRHINSYKYKKTHIHSYKYTRTHTHTSSWLSFLHLTH